MTFAMVETRGDDVETVRIDVTAVRVVIATVMTGIVETVAVVIETIEIAEVMTETVVGGTGIAAADAMSAEEAVTIGIEVAVMTVTAVNSEHLYSLVKSDNSYRDHFATYSRECFYNIKF